MIDNSLVVPIYRNAENIKSLFVALENLSAKLDGNLEVIFVIDGSPDDSGEIILNTPRSFASRTIFHSRNFGSFTAIRTGMEFAKGSYIAAMAADLQEPPELILAFFKLLRENQADVVFGERTARADSFVQRTLSNIFWSAYRRMILPAMPKGGVDIFGCNRKVLDALLQIEEPNSSLVAQLFWVGYRRKFVPYARQERKEGKSGWNFSRRLRYMMDSIFSFSDLPILAVLWIGVLGSIVSLFFGVMTIVGRLFGYIDERGYATIVLMISLFGFLNMVVLGLMGCYLWRALENTKRRPLRLISHIVEGQLPE